MGFFSEMRKQRFRDVNLSQIMNKINNRTEFPAQF